MSVRWTRKLAELAALTEQLRTVHPHAPGAPNRDQWDAWWATADRVRKQLVIDGPELIRRAAESSVDGYGTQSGGAGPGPKGTVSRPTQRLALSKVASERSCHQFAGDPGFPCDRCGQESGDHRDLDPVRHHVLAMVHHTGAAVGFFRVAVENVGSDDAEVLRYVDYGVRRLVKATAARARALPPVVVQAEPVDGCTHCAKFGVFDRVHKASYCRACYEYLRRHDGRLPTPELVRARDAKRVDRELEKKAGGR